MDEDNESIDISNNRVSVLEGHSGEVFVVAWNPKEPLLASGYLKNNNKIINKFIN